MAKKISEYGIIERCTKKVFALYKGSTRIGRNSQNNIRINSRSCSTYHAAITIRNNIIWFNDFSNNGTYVMKREKYILVKNKTTRIYENSKFQVANKEFKVIKIKNNIIEISDSEEESNKSAQNEKNDSEVNLEERATQYHWKKQKILNLIMKSTKHLNSDDEIEINDENKKLKQQKFKSSEFINTDNSSDSEVESNNEEMPLSTETKLLTENEIKMEIISDDEFNFDLYNQ